MIDARATLHDAIVSAGWTLLRLALALCRAQELKWFEIKRGPTGVVKYEAGVGQKDDRICAVAVALSGCGGAVRQESFASLGLTPPFSQGSEHVFVGPKAAQAARVWRRSIRHVGRELRSKSTNCFIDPKPHAVLVPNPTPANCLHFVHATLDRIVSSVNGPCCLM